MADTTFFLNDCLDRLKRGELGARDELIGGASRRLVALANQMLQQNQRIARWEGADDLFQRAAIRLHQSLAEVVPPTAEDFLRFAAAKLRRELIELARHYYGPLGLGANHATPVPGCKTADEAFQNAAWIAEYSPQRLALWTEFHSAVDRLPEIERRVFDLLWYHQLTQVEAAQILKVPERQLRRYWQSARLNLRRLIGDTVEMF